MKKFYIQALFLLFVGLVNGQDFKIHLSHPDTFGMAKAGDNLAISFRLVAEDAIEMGQKYGVDYRWSNGVFSELLSPAELKEKLEYHQYLEFSENIPVPALPDSFLILEIKVTLENDQQTKNDVDSRTYLIQDSINRDLEVSLLEKGETYEHQMGKVLPLTFGLKNTGTTAIEGTEEMACVSWFEYKAVKYVQNYDMLYNKMKVNESSQIQMAVLLPDTLLPDEYKLCVMFYLVEKMGDTMYFAESDYSNNTACLDFTIASTHRIDGIDEKMVFSIHHGVLSPISIPEGLASSKYQVQVINMAGQTVAGFETSEIGNMQCNVSAEKGMLILRLLNTHTGAIFTQKLIH